MKFLGVALTCLVLWKGAIAQKDLLGRLPNCATRCLEATLPSSNCSRNDIGCLCIDVTFQTALAGCNALNCTVVESLRATNETNVACGIPIRDDSKTMIAVTASIGALAVLMVTMRLAHRLISAQAELGWDDLLIGLAGVASLFQNVPVVVAGHLGFGKDMWGIPPDGITNSLKWLYVTYFMYQVAEFLCQLSILAFYLRVVTSAKLKLVTYTLMGLVTCFGLGNTFAMMLQCKPIHLFWDGWKGTMAGKCTVDVRLFGFVRGGIEIVLDLAILSLPLPVLARLQMSWKKKFQIMSMFCVGFIITVVSCLRLWALVRFDQSANPTYDNVSGVYWCVTEANLFIVVACMPAMHGLFQRIMRRIGGKSENSGYSNYSHGDSSKSGQRSGNSLAFGAILKSVDVKLQREDRSESDVELVDRPPYR
ncbi:uncharacterized protein K460DRAFT_304888 [Cucurbitaria berberidis CBS 394.84]|uniref:CFEM domain-containing protein n=1 Tax=Cucurbitaria berberidis CBS 394.84 TaxID=1168544 RepID=A0A9P4LBI6_9PLEO|nr:uncharacterized protein K460DRAFT_304888 [Cucurbitaria berberidis CBS 394.84]KAF1849095.1 hypothetical protein K460DRAFT_304888 [Cucurbitaria berberidis CBS 394.84]